MYMVFLVLDDPARLDAVLQAWEEAGINGATIVESTGFRRRRKGEGRVPTRYTFGHTSGFTEEGHYTFFIVVPDEATARLCLEATEKVVGDLNEPNTGILAAWPLSFIKGLPDDSSGEPN